MRPLMIFVILCGALTMGLWASTQYEAAHVPVSIRGTPWTTVGGYAIYRPHALLGWWFKVDSRTRAMMSGSTWILYGAGFGGMLLSVTVMKVWAVKKKMPATAMAARYGATWLMRNGPHS
jgi:hypothetical protein